MFAEAAGSGYRRAVLALFYAALVSLPLSVDLVWTRGHFGLLAPAEPLLVATAAALGLGLLGGWLPRPRGRASRLDWLVGLHLGALALATAFSTEPVVSAKYLATLVLYVAVGYALPRLLALQRAEWVGAGLSLGLGTLGLAGYVLVRHLGHGVEYQLSYTIAAPFLRHGHTNLTVLLEPLVLGLNLLLLHYGPARHWAGRWAIALCLVVVLAVVSFSYSRASYISLLAQGLVLLGWVGRPAARRLLPAWAAAAVVIFGLWQVLDSLSAAPQATTLARELSSIGDFSSANESNAERSNRWAYALVLWQHRPVAGTGPGTFPDHYLAFARNNGNVPHYYTTLRRMNAHNLYLDWLAESGVPGLLSGVLLLGYLVGQQVRRVDRRQVTPKNLALTAYFLFFLLHSFSQDFWQEPRVIVLFWLVAAWQQAAEPQTAATEPAAAQMSGSQ